MGLPRAAEPEGVGGASPTVFRPLLARRDEGPIERPGVPRARSRAARTIFRGFSDRRERSERWFGAGPGDHRERPLARRARGPPSVARGGRKTSALPFRQ